MLLRRLAATSLTIIASTSACATGAVPPDSIVITDSGSTNVTGYQIVVSVQGRAHFESGPRHGTKRLPQPLLKKLKYDVMMAQPLSHVRARPDCMKPVSFGSTTTVALGPEHSADLNCTATPKGEALKNDADAIADFLNLPTPRHPQP